MGHVDTSIPNNVVITFRPPPDPSVLVRRPPVVTIMGHVQHSARNESTFLMAAIFLKVALGE